MYPYRSIIVIESIEIEIRAILKILCALATVRTAECRPFVRLNFLFGSSVCTSLCARVAAMLVSQKHLYKLHRPSQFKFIFTKYVLSAIMLFEFRIRLDF